MPRKLNLAIAPGGGDAEEGVERHDDGGDEEGHFDGVEGVGVDDGGPIAAQCGSGEGGIFGLHRTGRFNGAEGFVEDREQRQEEEKRLRMKIRVSERTQDLTLMNCGGRTEGPWMGRWRGVAEVVVATADIADGSRRCSD